MRVLPLLVALVAGCAGPRPTLRYTSLSNGRVAGEEVVTLSGHEHVVHSTANDRGHVSDLTSRLVIDARGLPTSTRTSGTSYNGNPVDESFGVIDGVARWHSRAEHGEQRAGDAFYVSLDGTEHEAALLLRAALARPDHRLPLLPAGELRVEKVAEHGTGARHATCYAATGLSFAPGYLWLDDAGELYGDVGAWFSTIRAGAEAEIPELLKIQDDLESARGAELAKRLLRRPPAIVIRDVGIFDPVARRIIPGRSVVVHGQRIAFVGSARYAIEPPGAEIVDGHGATLLPGLWDMHAHMFEDGGLLDIVNGVTSARDMGNDFDMITRLRRQFADGSLIGPRLFLAGLVDGPGQYHAPIGLLVSSADEARAAVTKLADAGFEQLKIYSSVDPALVPTLVELAHARKMRVSGHIPAGMTAEQAVRAGFDEIQHVNMLVLNFMPDVKETRTPARFTEPGQRAADLDLDSQAVRDFIALLAGRHTVLDPTLATFEDTYVARDGQPSPIGAPILDRVPLGVRRGFFTGGLPVDAATDARYRASWAKMVAFVGRMHAAGVPIVAGTDAIAGFGLQRELELEVAAGIPPAEALAMATLGVAQIMGHAAELGTIEEGKLADLVLVDGDPTASISAMRNVRAVIKDGAVVDLPGLRAALGLR